MREKAWFREASLNRALIVSPGERCLPLAIYVLSLFSDIVLLESVVTVKCFPTVRCFLKQAKWRMLACSLACGLCQHHRGRYDYTTVCYKHQGVAAILRFC